MNLVFGVIDLIKDDLIEVFADDLFFCDKTIDLVMILAVLKTNLFIVVKFEPVWYVFFNLKVVL